jgi:hypothetical protein
MTGGHLGVITLRWRLCAQRVPPLAQGALEAYRPFSGVLRGRTGGTERERCREGAERGQG